MGVFHGGFSTFLAIVLLTISDSYIFQTFFLMFAFVIFFGLFHAIVFLPLAMSVIGPMPDADTSPEHGVFEKSDSVEADTVVQPQWGQRNKPRGLDEIPDIKFDKFICCALGAGD